MKTSKPKNWSREKLPIGSVRIRNRNRGGRRGPYKVRFVKIRNDGPKSGRWIPLATHWWRTNKGPVPAGMRVCHLDGDTLNDDPLNYGLLSAGDVMFLAHDRDAKMSERNREACRQGTIEHNRLRARVNRALCWLPTRWYAVVHDRRSVINDPYKSMRGLLRSHGVTIPINGVIPKEFVSLLFEPMRGKDIAAKFNHYDRVEAFDLVAVLNDE